MKSEIKINKDLFNSEMNSIRISKEQTSSSLNSNEIKDIEKIVLLLEKLKEATVDALGYFLKPSELFSNLAKKGNAKIIHADDDRNVRFNQSVDLINRLTKRKIPFETRMIVDDTHHWMNNENAISVYQAAADYFVKKLKP